MNFDPTTDAELRALLDPQLTDTEREQLVETMRLFERERPTPLPEFVERLAGHLGFEQTADSHFAETADLLSRARPLPSPAFRGKLARRLSAQSGPPPKLRLRIAAFAGSGALLLAIVTFGVAGLGPLAG
jgi:hypothetical protein